MVNLKKFLARRKLKKAGFVPYGKQETVKPIKVAKERKPIIMSMIKRARERHKEFKKIQEEYKAKEPERRVAEMAKLKGEIALEKEKAKLRALHQAKAKLMGKRIGIAPRPLSFFGAALPKRKAGRIDLGLGVPKTKKGKKEVPVWMKY